MTCEQLRGMVLFKIIDSDMYTNARMYMLETTTK